MKNNGQTNKQTNSATQTAVDKKENKKFPRFAFLKISLAAAHLAHLLFADLFFISAERQKAKEPISQTHLMTTNKNQ